MAEQVATPDQPQEPIGKGLLDDAWEKQQRKTFTAWCHANLMKVGMRVDDITVDFQDGSKLIKLLEVLSGDKLPKPERGTLRLHKIQNINKGLDFIKSKGVKLAGIAAEEICDGNLKMTLGMIWTVILRFQIQDISVEELSAKEGLLLWCQKKTKGYRGVNVQNFHISFKDGLAFCALIHRHRPDLLDYDSLKIGDAMHNLNLAFDVAEREIGIARMLDAEDMVNTAKPDERSVMTYVAAYYHAFASSQKNEIAARRIGKLLDFEQEIGALISDYEQLVSSLLAWIQQTIVRLQDTDYGNSMQGVQSKMAEFRNYRLTERPPKNQEKGKLESSYSTIQTKLRLRNRPPYSPAQGKLISDIVEAWKSLEQSEKAHETSLRNELIRQEKLEALASKFDQKARIYESWNAGKEGFASAADVGTSLPEVEGLLKQHTALETEISARSTRVEGLQAQAQELISENYHGASAVSDRVNTIGDSFARLQQLAADRRARLEESERKQRELDQLRFDFAQRAATFANWYESAKEDLLDNVKVYSVEEAEQAQSKHDAFKSALLGEPQTNYEGIMQVASNLENEGIVDNQYTTYTRQDVESQWQEIAQLVSQRDDALSNELARQNNNEQLRQEFANVANTFVDWIGQQNVEVAQGVSGSSEEQMTFFHGKEELIKSESARLQEVESVNQRIEEAVIFENKHATSSIESIRESWESLTSLLSRAINNLSNQILTRDMSGISDEQLQEYRQSYNHFDKDRSGKLDRLEFRACLLSLGVSLPELKAGEADPEMDRIMAQVDPAGEGYVEFDKFVEYMRKQTADTDTPDQIIDSFKVIAGDKDYVTADQLRRDLPPAQAEFCIQRMAPYPGVEGGLDFKSFTNNVYGV